MRVTSEINLRQFDAWGGAEETKDRIISEGKEDDFVSLIEELFENGISETQLNDLLRFDEEWIFSNLNISIH
jgi:hypothetical protein